MTDLPLPLRARRVVNLLTLATPLGLLVARVGGARVRPGPRGLLIAEGFRAPFPRAGAFTMGNVVVFRDDLAAVSRWHPDVLHHEDEHAWQWMACLGPPFLPLYGLAVVASFVLSGDRAAHNPFERAAGLTRGGYVSRPVRWLRPR